MKTSTLRIRNFFQNLSNPVLVTLEWFCLFITVTGIIGFFTVMGLPFAIKVRPNFWGGFFFICLSIVSLFSVKDLVLIRRQENSEKLTPLLEYLFGLAMLIISAIYFF